MSNFGQENLLVIGWVCSWKTEIVKSLSSSLGLTPLDMGKLFRYAAQVLICEEWTKKINPNFEQIINGDKEEIKRIQEACFFKTKLLKKQLEKEVRFIKNSKWQLELFPNHKLDTPEINILASVIAKTPNVRKTLWQCVNRLSARWERIIITWHNLRETKTTDYKIIYLSVNEEIAAKRMEIRSEGKIKQEEAMGIIKKRNEIDQLWLTEMILKRVHNAIHINTVNLTKEKVSSEVLRILEHHKEERIEKFKYYETTSIQRKDFKWRRNFPMDALSKAFCNTIKTLKIPKWIDNFDLLMQCMLHAPAFEITEYFWKELSNFFKTQENIDKIWDIPLKNSLHKEKIISIVQQQITYLKKIQKDDPSIFREFDEEISSINFHDSSFSTYWEQVYSNDIPYRTLSIKLPQLDCCFILKPCTKELSSIIAKQKHYLHKERTDEFISFWMFLEWFDFPLAWVSYSLHDRQYKMELLQYLWIESHNTLEMTRAWNHPGSPKNTMSFLFSYAHKELKLAWEHFRSAWIVDKSLVGITTTINPNLWFTGWSFLGSNFHVFGMRPATLSYRKNKDNEFSYTTRRELKNKVQNDIFDAKIDQLPLNEMIMCYDQKRQALISQGKIYKMHMDSYKKI